MTWMVWLPLSIGVIGDTLRSIAFGKFSGVFLILLFLLAMLVLAGACIVRSIMFLGAFVVQGLSPGRLRIPAASLAAWLVALFMIVGGGGDYLHLGLAYPSYLLSGRLGAWRSGPVEFPWETYQIALGGQGTRTLVYAPDGKVGGTGTSMPPIADVQTWRVVRPLIGGFILVTTIED